MITLTASPAEYVCAVWKRTSRNIAESTAAFDSKMLIPEYIGLVIIGDIVMRTLVLEV